MSVTKIMARGVLAWAALGMVNVVGGADIGESWASGGWNWVFFSNAGGAGQSTGFTPFPSGFRSSNSTNNAPIFASTSSNSSTAAPTLTPISMPTQTYSSVSRSPISAPLMTSSSGNGPSYDALVNFGTFFPEASTLTTGNPQPWYTSPTVQKVFGGTPTTDQQKQFTDTVLQDVGRTFSLSGLSPSLTNDPNASARHTLSVVSGASYGPNPNAIGITDVGNNGFSFIDKLNYAKDTSSLALAVAHNVSHELMHAFGVGTHPDTTGKYVDAGVASWDVLTDPNATFSPAAADAIKATNFSPNMGGAGSVGLQLEGAQEVAAVPEPATLAIWSFVLLGGIAYRQRGRFLSAA